MSALSRDQVPEEWGIIAPAYERAFEDLSSQFAAEVLKLLKIKPGERVIDIAAGTGAFSLLAARAGAKVLATDFAPGMVARLRERITTAGIAHVAAEVMAGQALAVPDASFDASVLVLGLIFFPPSFGPEQNLRRLLAVGSELRFLAMD
jgi:ubiquinone/menaquinone biosynthesis C-methylase UbiE